MNEKKLENEYVERLNKSGYNVERFVLTLNPPGPCLTFKELDRLWKTGDKTLMTMYEALEEKLDGADVFYNEVGINLHPEFVEQLEVHTVFQCFDDPENSHNLSEPCAFSYDQCFVGNIAELDRYRDWGCKNVSWSPAGVRQNTYNSNLTFNEIMTGDREIDMFMMCDRYMVSRKSRLDQLAEAFPEAHFYGKGWSRGYLPHGKEIETMQNTKIGINMHLSSGPINRRTFDLPANGVLQICDNKSYLGKVFKLGKEVIGYDNIKECEDMCRYYLENDQERREIAARGWQRTLKDYNEITLFANCMDKIKQCRKEQKPKKMTAVMISQEQRQLTRWPRFFQYTNPYFYCKRIMKKMKVFCRVNILPRMKKYLK